MRRRGKVPAAAAPSPLQSLRAAAGFVATRPIVAGIVAAGLFAAVAVSTDAAAQGAAQGAGQAAKSKAAGAADDAMKKRIESLEEQLVDMQVIIGTLQSMSKSGAGPQPTFNTPVSSGTDAARIQTLESQLQTLSAQVQQLVGQVHAAGVPRRTEVAATGDFVPGGGGAGAVSSFGTDAATPAFGSTTVTPATDQTSGDPIGGLIDASAAPAAPQAAAGEPLPPVAAANGQENSFGGAPAPVATAALLPPNVETGDPKQLYEAAYGYLLQRDYGAAEVAFDEFLKRYANDSLASNAQYWLGETYFVRGQYKAAAGAFLKSYQTYRNGAKAPDSLLKLAMSLDRLGQKDAACTSYGELNVKFPNAPQNVKARAAAERERSGCH